MLRLANGRYVSAEAGGGGDLATNRTVILDWEQFRFANAPLTTAAADKFIAAGAVYLRTNN